MNFRQTQALVGPQSVASTACCTRGVLLILFSSRLRIFQAAFEDSQSIPTTVNQALPVSLMAVMTCMYCGINDNAIDEVSGEALQYSALCRNCVSFDSIFSHQACFLAIASHCHCCEPWLSHLSAFCRPQSSGHQGAQRRARQRTALA